MKKLEQLFCCTTCTTNKKQRNYSALTGIGKKYITYTVSIPLIPMAKKIAEKWDSWDSWYRSCTDAYTSYKPCHSWLTGWWCRWDSKNRLFFVFLFTAELLRRNRYTLEVNS
jgi:hypothetical protein